MAMARSIGRKATTGEGLTSAEAAYLRDRVVQREARRMANLGAVVERVEAVREEVAAQLPPATSEEGNATSSTFGERAEVIAEELGDDEVRDIFARLLADEVARPGRFSVRTLEAIRALDPASAIAFQKIRRFIIGGEVVILDGGIDGFLRATRGVGIGTRLDLQDAGLVEQNPGLQWRIYADHEYKGAGGLRLRRHLARPRCRRLP